MVRVAHPPLFSCYYISVKGLIWMWFPTSLVVVVICGGYADDIYCHLGVDSYCSYSILYTRGNTNTNEEIGVLTSLRKGPLTCRLDDLFLGIGAVILLETYIVGTIVVGWVDELTAAVERDDIVWILNNDKRIIRYWYSTSATYIFSIVLYTGLRQLTVVVY